jgi:hypothetical protein
MAIYDQISRHGGWLDLTCKNTGSTAIVAGKWVRGETGASPLYPNVQNIGANDVVYDLAGISQSADLAEYAFTVLLSCCSVGLSRNLRLCKLWLMAQPTTG